MYYLKKHFLQLFVFCSIAILPFAYTQLSAENIGAQDSQIARHGGGGGGGGWHGGGSGGWHGGGSGGWHGDRGWRSGGGDHWGRGGWDGRSYGGAAYGIGDYNYYNTYPYYNSYYNAYPYGSTYYYTDPYSNDSSMYYYYNQY